MTATDTDLDALLNALIERARSRPEPPLVNEAGAEVGTRATTGRLVVNAGDTILATWGNTTYDQTIECFASPADRDAQWVAPHDGAAAYTADLGVLWLRKQGVWAALGGPSVPLTSGGAFSTFSSGDGELYVAKGGVKGGAWLRARDVLHASYYRGAAFTTPANASQAIGFDQVISDLFALYNGGNGVFTCPAAGLWRAEITLGANATATGQWLQAQIQKAGPNIALGSANASLVNAFTAAASATLPLVAGDQLTTFMGSGVALAGRNNRDTSRCSFSYVGTG